MTARSAYLDESSGAWVLSRYRDVAEALRHPRLWPAAAPGEDQSATRDDAGRLRLRAPVQEALSSSKLARWQEDMAPLARRMVTNLATDRRVDLLAELALPWCFEFALLVLDVRPEGRDRVAELGTRVFDGTGAPEDSPLRAEAAEATAELDRIFAGGAMPMGEPTFVAISQTTPRLLASIWTALYENSAEADVLRNHPELWPNAVDELLRFAGIVRRIWRVAKQQVLIGDARIDEGQRVKLMLAAANRDPEQFVEPDRLDVRRRVTGQFALGAGRNSCAGAALVRMMVTVATRALLEECPGARLAAPPQWRSGSGYGFPEAVRVLLGR
jgi:cytochrome P450